MTDVSKLANRKRKKKSSLGRPPSIAKEPGSPSPLEAPEPNEVVESVDRRSLRKTGRTSQLATRVTPEFHSRVKQIAARDGLKICEILEKGVEMYDGASS